MSDESDVYHWVCSRCRKDNLFSVPAGTPARTLFNQDDWRYCWNCGHDRMMVCGHPEITQAEALPAAGEG